MNLDSLSPQESALLAEKILDVQWWAENLLTDPETKEPFKANFVEQSIFARGRKKKWVVIRVHRRGGKTTALSVLGLHGAAINNSYEVLIVCPDLSKVNTIFKRIRDFIAENAFLAAAVKSDTKNPEPCITFANGSTITGKTLGATGKKAGNALRSKGADLLIIDECALLKEEDYIALNPIITGDRYRRNGVQVYAASTPIAEKNRYYQWCHDENPDGWSEVHVPINENPDWPEADWRRIESYVSEFEWEQEYLAEFPNLGENAIRRVDIDAAMKPYHYDTKIRPGWHRVMGVDWDKVQAGVNIAIVEMDPTTQRYQVIYREEVSRGEYSLTAAVKRVIALDSVFQPDYLYVDRGHNDYGVEELKLYAKKNPGTRLEDRVVGIYFSQDVTVYDPVDNTPVQKRFKGVMVNHLMRLFEDHRIDFPASDKKFEDQLGGYKILHVNRQGFRTSAKNEHIIDAVGLACFGLFEKFANKFQISPARKSYQVPVPEVVKSQQSRHEERQFFRRLGTGINDRDTNRNFARGSLGSTPLARTKI